MNLFFGKISKKFDLNQIADGYYEAPKDSGWFADLQLGDYVYLIGGDKIQFWCAKEWRIVDGKDRLYFDIINQNLEISVAQLAALSFLKITKALIVLTSRSARGRAFFKLELLTDLHPEQLGDTAFYKLPDLYRKIKVTKEDLLEVDSKNIQIFQKDDKLTLAPADFYDLNVSAAFRDNLKYTGKGARHKDNLLARISEVLKTGGEFTPEQMGLRGFYDAFFCDYVSDEKYYLVGSFWEEFTPEDQTELFVKEGRWENGYENKFIEDVIAVPVNSFIAIKSAFVREKTNSVMKIKARGRVTGNAGDGRNLTVEWEKDFQPFEVEFGGYLTTIKEVRTADHIAAIWENETEDRHGVGMVSMNNYEEIISLIKYKKQVILQGPPGTGKTKIAKELAEVLISNFTKPANISVNNIVDILKEGKSLYTVANEVKYDIIDVDVKKGIVKLKKQSEAEIDVPFERIIDAYKNEGWRSASVYNADRRAAAAAKYIYETIEVATNLQSAEQYKFIQFHPSYSYEDFVRGIVAESKGDKIEYKNVNKILGHFAGMAKQNWDDSKKESSNITKEKKVREYFETFVQDIGDKLEDGVLRLTNSVSLIDVEEDAFRYKGNEGWSTLGNRMLYNDIIQSYLDGNEVRQDIKKNKNLSGLAVQHATYFVRVLNMFQEYLASNHLDFDQLNIEKVELKNYVLIIDEINRANLSSVLGELIYALEYRGDEVESMYSVDGSNKLILPVNLYIIGTMNTADRSVGHIDYAIRRRFAFVDIEPKDLSSYPELTFHRTLFDEVAAFFDTNLSPEFEKKDVQLGHSYFIDKTKEGGPMDIRLEYEIKPILREYVKDGILIGDNIKNEIENLHA